MSSPYSARSDWQLAACRQARLSSDPKARTRSGRNSQRISAAWARYALANSVPSGRDLLVGKMWNVGALARVLNGDCADISLLVEIEKGVLVEIACFGDRLPGETRCRAYRCP